MKRFEGLRCVIWNWLLFTITWRHLIWNVCFLLAWIMDDFSVMGKANESRFRPNSCDKRDTGSNSLITTFWLSTWIRSSCTCKCSAWTKPRSNWVWCFRPIVLESGGSNSFRSIVVAPDPEASSESSPDPFYHNELGAPSSSFKVIRSHIFVLSHQVFRRV